jgi:kynurenine formamidase
MKMYLDPTRYIETSEPLDVSLPLSPTSDNPRAWYVDPPVMEPVRTAHYVGSRAEGGSVNFRNIFFNPHGHGTHTECLGHITEEVFSVNARLKEYWFEATLITVQPKERAHPDGKTDLVITPDCLHLPEKCGKALLIRTLPNVQGKRTRNYSATNPPYFDRACVKDLLAKGVEHLLIDLPSVDRENDEGKLAFHHDFWEVPENPNHQRTITELIFVKDEIEDGNYLLNLHLAPFENDAAPSRPVLYKIRTELI